MSLPRLANTYCALQESFQYPFPEAAQLLTVTFSSVATMNDMLRFEPLFNTQNFLSNSPLATSMFGRYNEFRIRKVTCRLTPTIIRPVNQARSDIWIYWCPNHKIFDDDIAAGNTFDSVTDIAETARFQHVSSEPGRPVSMDFVPQVIFNNAVSIGGVASDQSGDGKMPWLQTSTANANMLLRTPVLYFRKPYINDQGVAEPEQYFQQYQVMYIGVIEFRSLEDDN